LISISQLNTVVIGVVAAAVVVVVAIETVRACEPHTHLQHGLRLALQCDVVVVVVIETATTTCGSRESSAARRCSALSD